MPNDGKQVPFWMRGKVYRIEDMSPSQLVSRLMYYVMILSVEAVAFAWNAAFLSEHAWYTYATLIWIACMLAISIWAVGARVCRGFL